MSSKYTTALTPGIVYNTVFINIWKVERLFRNPMGIRVNSKCPAGVENAVFSPSLGWIGI